MKKYVVFTLAFAVLCALVWLLPGQSHQTPSMVAGLLDPSVVIEPSPVLFSAWWFAPIAYFLGIATLSSSD